MGKTNFSKIKLLKIWEILKQESDEDRPLTTSMIIDRLADHGISCDRRTLYADINELIKNGYDIKYRHGQHSNLYYIEKRAFDIPELRIMMDAVQAANFITEQKSAELIDKIAALGGSNQARLLKSNVVEFNTTKHSNEDIYLNVSTLSDGISCGKKVSFRYFDLDCNKRVLRKNGDKYIVNPVNLVYTNDNYYLIGYHDNHNAVTTYRVDRMQDVEVTDEDINAAARPQSLDVSEHRKQAFSMFGGESVEVSFEADKSILDVIYDKFGEDLPVYCKPDNRVTFSAAVQLSPVFFGWCCMLGEKLKIVGPDSVVKAYINYIDGIISDYKIGVCSNGLNNLNK